MLLRKWMKKKRIPQNRVSLQKTLCTRLLSLIKKKKMQELEKLLNSLIQRGRMPFWKEANYVEIRNKVITISREDFFEDGSEASLRDITCLESELWQFVCKNKLHKKTDNFWESVSKTSTNIWWFPRNHQYRLLESALIPEEELGKFLVENIIITWNSK